MTLQKVGKQYLLKSESDAKLLRVDHPTHQDLALVLQLVQCVIVSKLPIMFVT